MKYKHHIILGRNKPTQMGNKMPKYVIVQPKTSSAIVLRNISYELGGNSPVKTTKKAALFLILDHNKGTGYACVYIYIFCKYINK